MNANGVLSLLFRFDYTKCSFCERLTGGDDGHQPICRGCHDFLFHFAHDHVNKPVADDKSDSSDSGNEEPSPYSVPRPKRKTDRKLIEIDLKKKEKLKKASLPSSSPDEPASLIASLPTEVLLKIFGYLDDLSTAICSLVCKRWFQIVSDYTQEPFWKHQLHLRWPLFRDRIRIKSWFKLYNDLLESVSCYTCFHQLTLAEPSLPREPSSWRYRRLSNEVRTLKSDPPEGIEAQPLDPDCMLWQASIRGPSGSPYEGGLFFVFLKIPSTYPLSPPVVRFLTRILHPNISRHGDVGLDSIHHNWSLALTIGKVLVSVQSLLTDPFTDICMERDVANLYKVDRRTFEKAARMWTFKYAMHDFIDVDTLKFD